jgi:uncharacterized protein (TIGR00303 family)
LISIHSYQQVGQDWLARYRDRQPHFACVLGFTDTCKIPGISAAGLTPHDRQFTALADGEFLARGVQANYQYPLPPLEAGASPAIITRAIVSTLEIPVTILNAGLPYAPSFPCVDLGGQPACCLTTGRALPIDLVHHLWQQGIAWGEKLLAPYVVIGECVVGGTTTALAVLTALGIPALGRVSSSHRQCNHQQKIAVVKQGLATLPRAIDPWQIIAAVGDPMQIVVAGMAAAASNRGGVLLAGGTQMLAVYALIQALADHHRYQADEIVVGTTGWVTKDVSADVVGLAKSIGPLLSADLCFAASKYPQLQIYEQGFVKEGVGAGGIAIAAALYRDWWHCDVLNATEDLLSLM